MMLKNWIQRSSSSSSRQLLSFYYSSCWRRSICSSVLNDHTSSRAHRFTSDNKSSQHLSYYDAFKRSSFATATMAADSDDSPLRRRRRKPSSRSPKNDESTSSNTSTSNSSSSSEAFFSPIDAQTGQLLTSDQYLELASLSPWVPCPDVVSKRVFEIASASEQDVHVDLGCGDGRLNFMAVDGNTKVGKSWGLDVDENILKKCHERLGRRFVPSKNKHDDDDDDDDEESMLEFVQADLVEVIELQKKLYQQQQQLQEPTLQQLLGDDEAIETSNNNDTNDTTNKLSLQSITNKIANSTIITMYFVDNALKQVQPYLSSILGGKQNVRVITIGYEMPKKDGWDASWVERVLGLTIFRYDMEGVSKFPLDWSLENDEEDGHGDDGSGHDVLDLTGENDQDVEEFLRRKRQEDMEELNRGLRIHHDEELDEFAHARAKKQGLNAQHSGSSSTTLGMEEEDGGDEWDDFDETEEPEELMKQAQRRMMEERKASRGKMMAGVRGGESNKSSTTAAVKKPTWKKP